MKPLSPTPPTRTSRGKLPASCKGFTLFEIFIVITIIVVLLSVGARFKLSGPRPAEAMKATNDLLEIASSEAFAQGTRTRVAICIDPTAQSRYLRYLVTLIDSDGDATTEDWKFSGNGRPLQQGLVFSKDYSSPAATSNTTKIDPEIPSTTQDGTLGFTFQFLEFTSIGESTSSGQQWVFTKGLADDSGAEPFIINDLDRDGFVLRQTGRAVVFETPQDITAP